ncbi:MAG: tRNA (adenosine(37)-N6)-threonylcarbamoyltransferase complex ATPase subunit type 1 TsaE, partial [Candidatus Omnitrophota bacterium]
KKEFISKSPKETEAIACRLARRLKKNDCLALMGCFGSGKTTFVKGLAKGLRVRKKEYVCSPSFVLLKIYPGRLPLHHFDLYRLDRRCDLEDIGFAEFISAGGVSVIEWADKFLKVLPATAVKIKFTILGKNLRRLSLS